MGPENVGGGGGRPSRYDVLPIDTAKATGESIRGQGNRRASCRRAAPSRQLNGVGEYLDVGYRLPERLDTGRSAKPDADGGAAAAGGGEGGPGPVSGSDVAPSTGSSGSAGRPGTGGDRRGAGVRAGRAGA